MSRRATHLLGPMGILAVLAALVLIFTTHLGVPSPSVEAADSSTAVEREGPTPQDSGPRVPHHAVDGEDQGKRASIQLEPAAEPNAPGSIEGQLTLTGRPYEGVLSKVTIELMQLRGESSVTTIREKHYPWVVYPDGTFRFTPVPPGRYFVIARHWDFTKVGEVTVEPGVTASVVLTHDRAPIIDVDVGLTDRAGSWMTGPAWELFLPKGVRGLDTYLNLDGGWGLWNESGYYAITGSSPQPLQIEWQPDMGPAAARIETWDDLPLIPWLELSAPIEVEDSPEHGARGRLGFPLPDPRGIAFVDCLILDADGRVPSRVELRASGPNGEAIRRILALDVTGQTRFAVNLASVRGPMIRFERDPRAKSTANYPLQFGSNSLGTIVLP